MQKKLIELSNTYLEAGNAIHDAVRDIIKDAGGFINASNNNQEKSDITALVFDSKKGYSEAYPIRGLRVNTRISICGEKPQKNVGELSKVQISFSTRRFFLSQKP